jgi:biotin carboxylase
MTATTAVKAKSEGLPPFQRILVANRGEIALRVIRACRDLGIEVVAIFSEADRGAPYLELADQAICIGPPVSTDSYLKIQRIISAAEIANVQATPAMVSSPRTLTSPRCAAPATSSSSARPMKP